MRHPKKGYKRIVVATRNAYNQEVLIAVYVKIMGDKSLKER